MKKKKVITIISSVAPIVAMIVLMFISRLNIDKAEKQDRIFTSNFAELSRIANEIVRANSEGGMIQTLTFIRENESRAAAAVKAIRGVCDYFENATVPSALKDHLAAVRAGIPAMRDFLNKYENMFHAVMLESEFKVYVSEMSKSAAALEEKGSFIAAEQAFMKKLDSLTSRRSGLMWL